MNRLDRHVRLLLGTAVAVTLVAVPACRVSQDEEVELGRQAAAEVDSEVPILRDTTIDRYVTALGHQLVAATSRAGGQWHFTVVNTSELNAFSLPGGYVYVNRGLIERSDRLDELAGVMAHEIGHIVRRHSVEQLEKSEKRDVGVVLLCTLTRACSSLGGAVAVRVGADAATARYSQHDESEADEEAVQYTVRAGYDPEGLPAFLQKMIEQRTAQPTLVDAIFATHPIDEVRIADLRRQIAALGDLRARQLVRDTPAFHAIQARLRALPPSPAPKSQ